MGGRLHLVLGGAINRNQHTDLSSEPSTLSGPNSGLANLWEEFAVQNSGEHSNFIDLYENHVRDVCRASAEKLGILELQILALFFSEPYIDWWFDRDEHGEHEQEPNFQELAQCIADEIYSEICQMACDDADEINEGLEQLKHSDEDE